MASNFSLKVESNSVVYKNDTQRRQGREALEFESGGLNREEGFHIIYKKQ